MAFAGLDIGTSGCKFAVYKETGELLCMTRQNICEYGSGTIREIDPQEVLQSVWKTVKTGFQSSPEPIEAIAITSMGESAVLLDKKDQILCRSMVTGDSRGIEEKERFIQKYGQKQIMERSGICMSEVFTFAKLLWMQKNTDILQKVNKIFLFEDYVGYLFTGERKISYSMASRTGMFDIRKKEWCVDFLQEIGLSSECLSQPVASGTIVGEFLPTICEELGINYRPILVAGGHDQGCAAFGAGLTDPGLIENGFGSCEAFTSMMPEARTDSVMMKEELICAPSLLPDHYLTFLITSTAGVLMNWVVNTFFKEEKKIAKENHQDIFAVLDRQVDTIQTEIYFLPTFGSSGNPHYNNDARGVISGLSIHSAPLEIYRAVKESLAYQMLYSARSLKKIDCLESEIRATGGGASEFTLQQRADIFGEKVGALENQESGTFACMMLSGMATGCYKDYEDAVDKVVKVKHYYYPNDALHSYYQERYEKFVDLYKKMNAFH